MALRRSRIGLAAPKPLRTLRRTIEQAVGHAVHEIRYVRELIAVEGPAEYAHPANWGAFVVFGMQS